MARTVYTVVSSVIAIALLVGTLGWIAMGIVSGADGWISGWMAFPIILVSVVPMLFAFRGLVGALSGGGVFGGMPAEFAGAPIAVGTVVSVQRTGLTVNDQPQVSIVLDVAAPDGARFTGTVKRIIDLTELSLFQPGLSLPVRYLPGDPSGRVVIADDASQEEAQDAVLRTQLAKGEITQRQVDIARRGVEARAVVLAMAPTGEIRGDRSVIELTLRVTRPDGSTFDLVQSKPVPPHAVGLVQAGSVVNVKYLAGDESEVTVALPLN